MRDKAQKKRQGLNDRSVETQKRSSTPYRKGGEVGSKQRREIEKKVMENLAGKLERRSNEMPDKTNEELLAVWERLLEKPDALYDPYREMIYTELKERGLHVLDGSMRDDDPAHLVALSPTESTGTRILNAPPHHALLGTMRHRWGEHTTSPPLEMKELTPSEQKWVELKRIEEKEKLLQRLHESMLRKKAGGESEDAGATGRRSSI